MTEHRTVQCGASTVRYVVVRSKRRHKTITIRLDPAGEVLVAAPMRTKGDEIDRLVNRRAGWIAKKRTEAILRPGARLFVSGESLPYLGRQVRMFVHEGDVEQVRVAFGHGRFHVTVPAHLEGDARRRSIGRAFAEWYMARAEERLPVRVAIWSARLGLSPTRVLVRDQKQRWGSCSVAGVLRFNRRLVMAEQALMDYVIVHELAHLSVRNHGSDFWAAMLAAMPDCRMRRARLREFGAGLAL